MEGEAVIMDNALDVRVARLEERIAASEKAVELQFNENMRRLHDLNGSYSRDRERQNDYVTTDKYEDKIAAMDEARIVAVESEKSARQEALIRVDEKFEDYIKRWELSKREQDATIATLSLAAAEAKQIAENQGRQTREEADRQARDNKAAQEAASRKQTRNVTIVGIALAAVVGLANLLPQLI